MKKAKTALKTKRRSYRKMGEKNKAIPTIGPRNIQFRSRIEAIWARFFDSLEWTWSYEPYDLVGYIPDFIVLFGKKQLLVEVKGDIDYDNLKTYAGKIEKSGWDGPFLIVGAEIWKIVDPMISNRKIATGNDDARVNLGVIFIPHIDNEILKWTPYDAFISRNAIISYVYNSQLCGVEADRDETHLFAGDTDKIYDLWIKAKNALQWKGPGRLV